MVFGPKLSDNVAVRITASVEYALQALLELARSETSDERVSAHELAKRQNLPIKFLESILIRLKRAGLIDSNRGPHGGYWLKTSAQQILVADVIRTIEGPLAAVGERAPEETRYRGAAKHLTKFWIVTRISMRDLFEEVTLQDLLDGKLPRALERRLAEKDSWKRRPRPS